MKRIVVMLLAALLLCGCAQKQPREVSCEELIAAYEAAGYAVEHLEFPALDYGYRCEVQIRSGEEQLRFEFYPSAEAAEAQAQQRQWNAVLWIYTLAMGQPTWLHTQTHGTIEIEYTDSALLKPFESLTK